jgi:indolepyruvate ferredoxin oxidoreductase
LRTAAFVSGYPGSPLGGLDQTLARVPGLGDQHGVTLAPALNEELAATAVWGTQWVLPSGQRTVDGVVGIWYGKSPGLDRAGDAIRHGNLIGAHPNGGVLVLVGDDPGAKSSTLPCASERTLAALGLPVLFPRNSADVVRLGLYGIALSRASGCWVGMKITADIADGFSTLEDDPAQLDLTTPSITWDGEPWTYVSRGVAAPPHNLMAERDLVGPRTAMIEAFIEQNPINECSRYGEGDWLGLIAAGKTYDDMETALRTLGLSASDRRRRGIRTLKLGAISPLPSREIQRFADGLTHLAVIEEKAAFVESQVRDSLYGSRSTPIVVGKRDADGAVLIPGDGELTSDRIREPLGRLLREHIALVETAAPSPPAALEPLAIARTPYFCSGCPHNRSTVVPEGSLAGGGIGCHAMVALIPRPSSAITGLTQMGAEGAQWIGQAPFHDVEHIFQNMGDGTFFHSGQLAVQACVAAGVNVTFKLLYNAAIAMTGGQQPQGGLDVPAITRKLTAEGVRRIIVCADEPDHYPHSTKWAEGVTVWGRDRLDEAQRELRETPGVTVLIYDQQCAAEARRLRKRGLQPTRQKRVIINEAVCEGCGDCGVKSNCLSVQPVDTEFGRKTRIDQASCNTDYSCLEGDCPAFVTVEAASPRSPTVDRRALVEPPATIDAPSATQRLSTSALLVGIGGTGVVTVNQTLATAALMDGYRVKGVDQTGLSQKAGQVTSHLRFGPDVLDLSGRIGPREADCLLAFDLLGASDAALLSVADASRTAAFASTARTPTGRMVFDRSVEHPDDESLLARLDARCQTVVGIDTILASRTLTGDSVAANLMLVGVAVQTGQLPLSPESIERAIELNGVSIEANRGAFRWGRVYVADRATFDAALSRSIASHRPAPETQAPPLRSSLLKGEVGRLASIRAPHLEDYQGARLASRYVALVERAWTAERSIGAETQFSEAVALGAHHLMAYKDEYEVARLLLDPAFAEVIESEVPGASRVRFQLHPPTLRALGLKNKVGVGPIGRVSLRLLRRGRRLRGTPFDPFGYAKVRRLERQLVTEYLAMVEQLIEQLRPETYARSVEGAQAALLVRGFEGIKLASVERYRAELGRLGLGRVMTSF